MSLLVILLLMSLVVFTDESGGVPLAMSLVVFTDESGGVPLADESGHVPPTWRVSTACLGVYSPSSLSLLSLAVFFFIPVFLDTCHFYIHTLHSPFCM